MSDETHSEASAPISPEAENKLPEDVVYIGSWGVTESQNAAVSAFERLRDFEDKKLGKLAVRINGRVERGYGSKFRELPEGDRAQHANLEKLVEAEHALSDAKTNLVNAESAYNDALAAVEAPEAPHASE